MIKSAYFFFFYNNALTAVNSRRITPSSVDLRLHYSLTKAVNESNSNRRLLATDPEAHRVVSLPGLENSDLVHYAGHIPVNNEQSGFFFYWLFETPSNALGAPLIIWLNGGPGCSSMDGLFLEVGPLKLSAVKRGSVEINPWSWHRVANIMFIDQPVGTGLSYTNSNNGYPTNDEKVNEHFYGFLVRFFTLHTRYLSVTGNARVSRPLIIAGESHAGHFIPSLVDFINQMNKNSEFSIQVEAVALGNPWIFPMLQYDVSDFAHGMGLISQGQKNKLQELANQCRTLLQLGKLNNRVCFSLLDLVLDSSSVPGSPKVLMYDSRRFTHNQRFFPPGHEEVEHYLNRPEVRVAIHANRCPHQFSECTDPPFNALSHQDGKGVMDELAAVLQSGVRVLVYSGQFDIICNHVSSEKALRAIKWSGRDDFLKAESSVWLVNKIPAGYVKTYKNLNQILVLHAGHMVPMDLPEVAFDLILKFVKKNSFSSGACRISEAIASPEEECFGARLDITSSQKRRTRLLAKTTRKGRDGDTFSLVGYNGFRTSAVALSTNESNLAVCRNISTTECSIVLEVPLFPPSAFSLNTWSSLKSHTSLLLDMARVDFAEILSGVAIVDISVIRQRNHSRNDHLLIKLFGSVQDVAHAVREIDLQLKNNSSTLRRQGLLKSFLGSRVFISAVELAERVPEESSLIHFLVVATSFLVASVCMWSLYLIWNSKLSYRRIKDGKARTAIVRR